MDRLKIAELLVDPDWYRVRHGDAAMGDPVLHFAEQGMDEGLDPNAMFDAAWYRTTHGAAMAEGISVFEDFCENALTAHRDPGPLFDTAWYCRTYPDIAAAGVNPLHHYLHFGRPERRDASPLFHNKWYFAAYPFADSPGMDAPTHFMNHGAALGLSPSPFFDVAWYGTQYPEVARRGMNPLLHYLLEGEAKGYQPAPGFDPRRHAARHRLALPDGRGALRHFAAQPERRRAADLQAKDMPSRFVRPGVAAEARAMIALVGGIEADLADLPGALEQLPVTSLALGPAELAWRSLFLSLETVPRRILLAGHLDDVPELADLPEDPTLLVLETDGSAVSVGRHLRPGITWRSLPAINPGLDEAGRARVVTALLNAFRPLAIMAWGSHAGGEAFARHGANLRVDARLFIAWADGPMRDVADLMRRHFRRSLPFVSLSYAADLAALNTLADGFGLPEGARGHFRPLDAWRTAEGFLGAEPPDR
ncbi:hypothetical protein KTR66_06785 [Roseococcus sp. SDR]|uniref:hypothetical protein n=1 Tax=Roseococcus sp. SDR TaxID=2835532 RepID=UPI001BCD1F27|nr:hypothetical protein [Roseococcus sp. SDR]MBS7789691.1 hypothetical protein [Roseococcus sp. SDR]MBV1845005.1 hypothetical protein [Roseococcus sp. SDR]